tara:strand:+ start:766 stop:894 length:129 start_codon:yes stop_codon:yes gene_type:complete
MIKKIILVFVCIIILVSCGRKGDPKYNEDKQTMLLKKVYEIY